GMGPVVSRVVPTTASGTPLKVAPHEIAFLPQPTTSLYDYHSELPPEMKMPPTPPPACQAGGAYDRAHTDTRAPWRAVVTFPSCDLVAVLEPPSGKIVSSVYVRSTGVVDAGTEPVCPTDCGIGVVPPP